MFLSDLMNDVATIMKMKKVNTSAYHLQTDGLTERFNRTLVQIISMYSNSSQQD